MLDTSARLLRLLTLLQARRFWTGEELATRLAITRRTLRRDVDRLRRLGYPVASSAGVAGGYHLGSGARLPPLLLEDDEALAVSLGLSTAAAGTVGGVEEAALRALAKLSRVLPERLQRKVRALHRSVSPLYFAPTQVDAALLASLAAMSNDHVDATFRYADRHGVLTKRVVQPHGLVHTGWRWYLLAWDLDRADWRTFRVDRIEGRATAGAPFVAHEIPGGSAASLVSRSISSAPYEVRARILLHAPRSQIVEKVPPLAGFVSERSARRCVLESGAHSLDALAIHVAALGVDFQVIEPPELVQRIRALAERLTRAADRSMPRGATSRARTRTDLRSK